MTVPAECTHMPTGRDVEERAEAAAETEAGIVRPAKERPVASRRGRPTQPT